ncbi:MAG: hypothetical protein AAF483_28890 [Planctomycetota bacterium]
MIDPNCKQSKATQDSAEVARDEKRLLAETLVKNCESQLHRTLGLIVYLNKPFHNGAVRLSVHQFRCEPNDVARVCDCLEFRCAHFGKHDFLGEVIQLGKENASCLCHAFDDQRMRIVREARQVIIQRFLGQGNVFDGDRFLSGDKLFKAVNPIPTHRGSRRL